MLNQMSPSAWLIVFLLVAGVVVGLCWFGWKWKKRKDLIREQAARLAEKNRRRQKKREDRHKLRQEEVSAVRTARANGDRRPVILVVDDSPTALEAARRVLEENRYRVVTAIHGKDAWATLQDLHPDLILTDIEMPHLDGFSLLRMVRSDLALADIPVVFMTANPVEHIHAGKKQGIAGFLVKPFEDEDLVGQLRYLLQE